MRIGIIGSGNIGGTLTRKLRDAGHDVIVANSRGPQSLTELSVQTGATAADVAQAARDAEVVVLAVPMGAVGMLSPDAFRGKIIVDADNYLPDRDGDIAEIADRSLSSSRWTAAHFPGARVVKAFNTIYADRLLEGGRSRNDPHRIALPVASDDQDAKETVMAIVDEIGFDPVDAGTLDESWRQQPNTPVFGSDHDAEGVRRDLATARP